MKAKSRTPIGPSQNFYKYKILTQNLIQDKKKIKKKLESKFSKEMEIGYIIASWISIDGD
jgi:hypothetical protein